MIITARVIALLLAVPSISYALFPKSEEVVTDA